MIRQTSFFAMTLALAACLCFSASSAQGDGLTLKLGEASGNKTVEAIGFDESQWLALEQQADKSSDTFNPIRLLVKPETTSQTSQTSLPAVFGKCELDSQTKKVVFQPRYPLLEGVRYLAELRLPEEDKAAVTAEIFTEKPVAVPSTKVIQVYPTADELPENLLKFYILFSAPMSSGEAYQHIELVSDDGKQLMNPFLEIAEELWDPSGQRLTLLLDPARVKRGLVPHEEDGAILFAGTTYHLTIKHDWLDATGTPMTEDFKKTFKAIVSDYTQPKVSEWQIVAPPAHSRAPLVINLQEPLDHAIVTRGIEVFDSRKKQVDGHVSLSEQESVWSFTPTNEWPIDEYSLRINDRIEDLVGNSIAKPFEVDRFDEIESPAPRHVELRFNVVDQDAQ